MLNQLIINFKNELMGIAKNVYGSIKG